jgi:hypothetical protein
MKSLGRNAIVVMLIVGPTTVHAQHGRGGFHGGGAGGGGFPGRAMGAGRPSMAAAPRAAAPIGHPYAGRQNAYFSNRPDYHGGWYRGDWHGQWAGPWGYRPWGWGWYGGWGWAPGWGLGVGWGLGATNVSVGVGSPWNWGYFGYNNPYWAGPVGGVTYVNYSQPVVVPSPSPTYSPQAAPAVNPAAPPVPSVPRTPAQTQGLNTFANAQALFRQGEYQAALNETNRAVALLPNDSLMHEFRGLCLFALGDYQTAAAAVHAVVSVGPGWNWGTVSNLYGSPNAYTSQLRALESYCNEHPDASAPRFLLAYHYLLAEHNQEAAAVLTDVVRLQPDDQLATQLLKGLTTPPEAAPAPPSPPAHGRPVEPANLLGHWRASRPDGSSFVLDLTDDNRFNWQFKGSDREQQFSGTYTLAKNFLILSANDQNSLVGQVSLGADDKLNFRLAGGNPAEPGLTFTR